ncbi:WhiB family transcriptional regulator [Mycolicibacterium mucogenicum]|uniref:WhiB family transcriptional regulator n=1 Tax=Mycolicibacterium mucogenicum TaxID=56689 RepID=UPI002E1150B1
MTTDRRRSTTLRALIPRAEEWEWQVDARCRGEESTLFFHPDGERGNARRKRQKAAVAICAGCGVQLACLNHALRVPEMFGTWGGVTEDDRNQYLGLARHPRIDNDHGCPTAAKIDKARRTTLTRQSRATEELHGSAGESIAQ